VWDTDLKGFCARRQRGTAVSYLLKTRLNGRIRSFTIGRHGQPWTPDTARKHARDILSNPSIADKPSDDITQPFTQAAERFLDNHGLATASPKPLSAMLISATIRCASSPTTPDSSSQTPSGANRASRRSASCAGGCRSL